MNNGNVPTGFQPAPPPEIGGEAAPAGPKKKGGRRGPRAAAPKAKNGRRSRKIDKEIKRARVRQAAAQAAPVTPLRGKVRTLKVDLATVVSALTGLSETEAATVAAMTQSLQLVPKKSRGRILAALAKMGAA